MQSWICTICQYIYDPTDGDPVNEIPPETSFEDLLEAWSCPICKAGKSFSSLSTRSKFQKVVFDAAIRLIMTSSALEETPSPPPPPVKIGALTIMAVGCNGQLRYL
jgi:rubredoxin